MDLIWDKAKILNKAYTKITNSINTHINLLQMRSLDGDVREIVVLCLK